MSSLRDDREDDIRLPARGAEQRRTARDGAAEYDEQASDREFTLSTGTVLGMFFALALICAVFFGFGYTMGRKSGQATTDTANTSAASADSAAEVATAKPSPGAPAIQTIPGYMSQGQAEAAHQGAATQAYKPAASANLGTPTTVIVPTQVATGPKTVRPAAIAADGETPAPTTVTTPATPPAARRAEVKAVAAALPPPAAIAVGTPTSYVQIAAVSHQEDADVLLSALKRRGYTVFARPGETDKLIHVQVGPFATKKDADAMKQRLMGDGYNAIVK